MSLKILYLTNNSLFTKNMIKNLLEYKYINFIDIELNKNITYDIFISDFDFIESNQLHTLKEVKKRNPKVYVIVYADAKYSQLLIDFINLGINKYLLKPFNINELTKTIKEVAEDKNIENQGLDKFINSLINSLPLPTFYKNNKGVYLGTNEEFNKLFGYEKNELIGKNVYDIASKEIADRYHATDKELFNNPNTLQSYEYIVTNKKRNLSYNVIFYKKALFDSTSNVVGLIGVILDITKMKEDENQIKTLLKVFDSNIIATKTDLKGNITYTSKAFEEISGFTKEELIGKNHNIVRHPNTRNEVFKDLWDTLKEKKIWENEIQNRKKDGSSYWVKASIKPEFKNDKHIGYTSVRIDITDKKKLEGFNNTLEKQIKLRTKEIERKLYFDDLTKLQSNYSLMEDIKNTETIFTTLMLINIDNFQNINNVYGFEVGNNVLIEFANFLREFNQNNTYKIYRVYADEFALLKNFGFFTIDAYYEELLQLKKKVLDFNYYIEEIDEYIQLDITVGLSFSQDNPISSADMALRYAKNHKLAYQVFNNDIDLKSKLQDSLEWKKKLKKALNDNNIFPVYQAIVDKNEEIIKYEVLMRIKDSKGNLISPSLFLEDAINSKIYTKLAINIFEKAFKVMTNEDKLFSINLSFEDLFNKSLIDFIETNIKTNPNLARKLVIEILETHEINNTEIMDEFLNRFRKYGVKIAIDDFGMGHSNLSHILQIKPDYIKIDGVFIKNIDKDKKSYALVKSVITLSKELNIKVIAEYVHSKEVFETLKKMGIDEFQGYYFAAPVLEI